VAAISSASTSPVNFAKAFFEPSGLHPGLVLLREPVRSAVLPDHCVDLDTLDIVKLLQRLLDLPLVRLDVHNKDQCVILLNLLHRTLRVERVDDDLAGIEARLMRDRLARVLWCARELERLGAVEGSACAHFADLVRVDLYMRRTGRQMMGALTRLKVDIGRGLRRGGSPLLPRWLWQMACWPSPSSLSNRLALSILRVVLEAVSAKSPFCCSSYLYLTSLRPWWTTTSGRCWAEKVSTG
jgi:hypothetical protein